MEKLALNFTTQFLMTFDNLSIYLIIYNKSRSFQYEQESHYFTWETADFCIAQVPHLIVPSTHYLCLKPHPEHSYLAPLCA